MWPKVIEDVGYGGLLAMVRSKFFVAEQVPHLWRDLHPTVCDECDWIQAKPRSASPIVVQILKCVRQQVALHGL